MLEGRLEDKDFGPRVPFLRLALCCAAFGTLGLLFALETRNAFVYGLPRGASFWAERAFVCALILTAFAGLVLFLLLPFRLRFTEAGLERRTLFGPRFLPWAAVRGARLTRLRGYFALELSPGGWRWLLVPLLEYRRAATLLAEISRRLPCEVQDPGGQLAALLRDD